MAAVGEAQAPKLYGELAPWWQLMSAPGDYAEEAGVYARMFREACGDPKTVLELGSGGGNNASHLKQYFAMTLVDLSPGMLDVSRGLNPECEHALGDMRSVRLGREFDAVFLYDAVMYLTSVDDLARTLETAFVHCRPGGAALVVPDCFRETFRAETTQGGHDGDGRGGGAGGDVRSLRYLQWQHDPDPADDTFVTDIVFLLREDGDVRAVHDRHVMGLFSRDTWLGVCRDAGFEARIETYRHSELDHDTEVILCRRP